MLGCFIPLWGQIWTNLIVEFKFKVAYGENLAFVRFKCYNWETKTENYVLVIFFCNHMEKYAILIRIPWWCKRILLCITPLICLFTPTRVNLHTRVSSMLFLKVNMLYLEHVCMSLLNVTELLNVFTQTRAVLPDLSQKHSALVSFKYAHCLVCTV